MIFYIKGEKAVFANSQTDLALRVLLAFVCINMRIDDKNIHNYTFEMNLFSFGLTKRR